MAAAVAAQQPHKLRWGELEDDEDGSVGGAVDLGLHLLLPPRVVVGPDAAGIRKVIEYRLDDGGNRVKVTTTTRTRMLARAHLSRSALDRRSWAKFGDAVEGNDAGSRLTMVSTEEVLLERPRVQGNKDDEPTTSGNPLGCKGGAVLMLCRTCGKKGDHWTSKCPYKDLVLQTESYVERPPTGDGAAAKGGSRGSTYVPPIKKEGADTRGASMMRRNDENSVRVNNLSYETCEPDLYDLFCKFGPISRVYIATDRRTGSSRGFGFVHFVNREDGEKAISRLNGYGYDNLILQLEWSGPRPN